MLKRCLFLLLCLCGGAFPLQAGVCEDWNHLYIQIRDFALSPEQAKAAFAPLHQRLRETYDRPGIGGTERFYPVLGYDASWGEKGAAYRPRGYKFFSGNRQGIHPSLDSSSLTKIRIIWTIAARNRSPSLPSTLASSSE